MCPTKQDKCRRLYQIERSNSGSGIKEWRVLLFRSLPKVDINWTRNNNNSGGRTVNATDSRDEETIERERAKKKDECITQAHI